MPVRSAGTAGSGTCPASGAWRRRGLLRNRSSKVGRQVHVTTARLLREAVTAGQDYIVVMLGGKLELDVCLLRRERR